MTEGLIHSRRSDERGLIPAVVQDNATGQVIAFRYFDNAALARVLQTGQGNFAAVDDEATPLAAYRLVDVLVNADKASITVLVDREGQSRVAEETASLLRESRAPAMSAAGDVSLVDVGSMEFGLAINQLYALIADRKEKRPEGSYTTYLFNSGLDKILKKIAEEAGEVIIAAKNRAPREIVSELADLFYHLLVLMVDREVRLSDVHGELARRAAHLPQAEE